LGTAKRIRELSGDIEIPILSDQNWERKSIKATENAHLGQNPSKTRVRYVREKGRTHQIGEQRNRGRLPEGQREYKSDRVCKPNGIEEGDQIVNPKAPSIPQTPQVTAPPVPPVIVDTVPTSGQSRIGTPRNGNLPMRTKVSTVQDKGGTHRVRERYGKNDRGRPLFSEIWKSFFSLGQLKTPNEF
jgi:hypothetical protein